MREQIEADGQFEAAVAEAREAHFLEEMALATNRLADADVAGPMVESLALKGTYMVKGREKEHLSSLLRHATYRGSDVRSFLEVDGRATLFSHQMAMADNHVLCMAPGGPHQRMGAPGSGRLPEQKGPDTIQGQAKCSRCPPSPWQGHEPHHPGQQDVARQSTSSFGFRC